MAAVNALAGGASGFADSRPCPALAENGRRGRDHTPPRLLPRHQRTIHGDVHDPATFSTALAGCQAACYLVHSLSDADFSATIPAPPKRSARP